MKWNDEPVKHFIRESIKTHTFNEHPKCEYLHVGFQFKHVETNRKNPCLKQNTCAETKQRTEPAKTILLRIIAGARQMQLATQNFKIVSLS